MGLTSEERMSKTTVIMIISLFIFSQCSYKKSSDVERDKILMGFVVDKLGSGGSAGAACSASAPFSSIASAGVTAKCASCHSASSSTAGVDMTSYTSVSAKVIAKDPEGSALYKTIKNGTMAKYSDSSINNAVYCWILAGATQ
jgi:hypothetical protein